jgi:predicted deacylase
MHRIDHPLLSASLGSQKTVTSFHFGGVTDCAKPAPKIYIQASLHAEELPGMLVAHHLRTMLERAQAAHEIVGEIILVPVANPIGLAQRLDHKPMGRFELETSENFNRNYPNFSSALVPADLQAMGEDPRANVAIVRAAMARYLHQWVPDTELQSLRRTLLTLSHDADFVLDLHCDCEAVMHFYTEEPCWAQMEPLARHLQSEAILLAKSSGGMPFDECLSSVWWRLSDALAAQGHTQPLPQGCCSATIELRGELDVGHSWAQSDAQAIWSFLQHVGAIASNNIPPVPPFRCQPTPVAGSETLTSPGPGVLVFIARVGQKMRIGDLVAEVIDPIAGQTHRILAGVDGTFYARVRDRYVIAGGEVGKIAGAIAFKTGLMLGA